MTFSGKESWAFLIFNTLDPIYRPNQHSAYFQFREGLNISPWEGMEPRSSWKKSVLVLGKNVINEIVYKWTFVCVCLCMLSARLKSRVKKEGRYFRYVPKFKIKSVQGALNRSSKYHCLPPPQCYLVERKQLTICIF